jgi:methylated-DNA-protein-cysteine methyltransferase related protein
LRKQYLMSLRTEHIISRIRAIPVGFVRTYGDIEPTAPRMVGHILATTDLKLPWYRVVRSDGTIPKGARQRKLLLEEGVPMRGDRVDLRKARVPAGVKLPS